MAGGRRFAGDECDFFALFLAKHADAVEDAAIVKMHHQYLLLCGVRLEKRLADPHLADVVPNALIEGGDTGRRAEHGADVLLCRSAGAHIFHRRCSKYMTVRRDLIRACGEASRQRDGEQGAAGDV